MTDLVPRAAVAPDGPCSSVRLSTIVVPDLDEALGFYRDVLGLQVDVDTEWAGNGLACHWRLPDGARARAVVLSAAGRPAGRVMLLHLEDAGPVPEAPPRWFLGHNNVNVYTADMGRSVDELTRRGYRFWSDPLRYRIGDAEGSPTEVFFDGPGGLPVNLIEPAGDPSTVVGAVAAHWHALGSTPTGYSEVTTSGVSVRSIDDAVVLYRDVLGLRVLMDFEVSGADRNRFLDLPPHAHSRNTFLAGDDLIGKVALMEALDHDVPAIPPARTAPPAPGCAATSVVVRDLDAVVAGCRRHGIELWGHPHRLDHPAFGQVECVLLQVPGSGALVEVVGGRAGEDQG